jgi:predicted  nucleic acid-binding Zn-ribbon protein
MRRLSTFSCLYLYQQVQNLEKERLEYEQNLSKLKRLSDQQRQDVVDLQAQLSEMESLKIQLQQ